MVLLAGLISAFLTSTHHRGTYLRLEVKSSVSSTAQVFFDIGRGISEEDSVAVPFIAGRNFQTLTFPLPDQPVRVLRFDPLTEPGSMVIRKATLLNDNGREPIPLQTLRPKNEIASMRFGPDGLVIETLPQAHDPQTQFELRYPILPTHPSGLSIAALAIVLFITTGLGCTVVLALLSTATGQRYLARWRSSIPLSFPQTIGVLLLVMLLMFLRAPWLLTRPRFWAEEGTVWFQHATTHSAFANFSFVNSETGYYILLTNIGAMLASATKNWFGLEHAPAATTYFAGLIQLIPFLIILCFKSHLFTSIWRIVAGCLILLCAPTATGEVWLNSVNSQTYLGAAALLVVFVDSSVWTRFTTWSMRVLLVLAGLSGLYAAVLFPLYAVSYRVYKERERIVQAALLAACFLVQLSVVLFARSAGGLEPTRFASVTPDTAFVNILFFEILIPIAGEVTARNLFHHAGLTEALKVSTSVPRSGTAVLAGLCCLALIVLTLGILKGRKLASEKGLLIGGFVIYAAVTSIASMRGIPNDRYAFLPGAILLFLLMDNLGAPQHQFIAVLCGFLLAVALFRGITMYRGQPVFAGPEWSEEVRAWQANPNYALRVWPSWWPPRIHLNR
jgi:hypothetical protein